MSPTVFRENGYRFFFHAISGDGEAKFWLEPEIELAKNHHYSRKQPKQIESLIEDRYNELIRAWHRHFAG
jgi:hypothetical protein